jgi:hypothetical protein
VASAAPVIDHRAPVSVQTTGAVVHLFDNLTPASDSDYMPFSAARYNPKCQIGTTAVKSIIPDR